MRAQGEGSQTKSSLSQMSHKNMPRIIHHTLGICKWFPGWSHHNLSWQNYCQECHGLLHGSYPVPSNQVEMYLNSWTIWDQSNIVRYQPHWYTIYCTFNQTILMNQEDNWWKYSKSILVSFTCGKTSVRDILHKKW